MSEPFLKHEVVKQLGLEFIKKIISKVNIRMKKGQFIVAL